MGEISAARRKQLLEKGKKAKGIFDLEVYRKGLQAQYRDSRIVEGLLEQTLENMGYKNIEEYEIVSLAHFQEKAKNELSSESRAYIEDLECICKNASMQIDPKYKKQYLQEVEVLKASGIPSLKAKETIRLQMGNRLGLKFFGGQDGQLKKQLAAFKENYDVDDDYLDNVKEVCEMLGINVPDAVERLERERISEEDQYTESIKQQIGIDDKDLDDDFEYESEDGDYAESSESEE